MRGGGRHRNDGRYAIGRLGSAVTPHCTVTILASSPLTADYSRAVLAIESLELLAQRADAASGHLVPLPGLAANGTALRRVRKETPLNLEHSFVDLSLVGSSIAVRLSRRDFLAPGGLGYTIRQAPVTEPVLFPSIAGPGFPSYARTRHRRR
jgi:hypothetical protein